MPISGVKFETLQAWEKGLRSHAPIKAFRKLLQHLPQEEVSSEQVSTLQQALAQGLGEEMTTSPGALVSRRILQNMEEIYRLNGAEDEIGVETWRMAFAAQLQAAWTKPVA